LRATKTIHGKIVSKIRYQASEVRISDPKTALRIDGSEFEIVSMIQLLMIVRGGFG